MPTALRSAAFVVLATAALAALPAAPAGAAEVLVGDPSFDTVDDSTGSATLDPMADVQGVRIVSTLRSLVLTVDMGIADFEDPPEGVEVESPEDLVLEVVLTDPSDTARQPLVWTVNEHGSGSIAQRLTGDVACSGSEVEAAEHEADDLYVLTAGADCARRLPRALVVSVTVTHDDGAGTGATDTAPDSGGETVAAAASGIASRLAGEDRILTAVALSQDDFADGDSKYGVVASAYSFPDALAGGPLATRFSAPLLLTAGDGLDARTLAELQRVVDPGGTVFLLGGTAALAPAVETAIADAGFAVERLAGLDRFETAVAVADAMPSHDTVVVTDGFSFTDALVAAAAAPGWDGVVVLTNGTALPTATRDYLLADTTDDELAIGVAAATAVGTAMDRIVGASAAELSANVAAEVGVRGAVAVATDAAFADSLAGGPHIARLGGALLLTPPDALAPAVAAFVDGIDDRLREVVVYGGTAAVSSAAMTQVEAALAA